jgi:gluconolactonase
MKPFSRPLFLLILPLLASHAQDAAPPPPPPAGIEVLDPEMERIVDPASLPEEIASGLRFTEGPVWIPAEGKLIFSDIPADRLYVWTPGEAAKVWREPSRQGNGNLLDAEGRLVTCEHQSRQVSRTEKDGTITVLAATHEGKPLNSPNDAAIKRDGTLWFSDPSYGLAGRPGEQGGNFVYRLDPGAKEPVRVAEGFHQPNGLCFSPDEKILYIADSGRNHHVRRFRVKEDNSLQDDGVFTVIQPWVPDGMKTDAAGRLYVAAGDGVQVFRADGTRLGTIRTPEKASNLCFGGADGRTLFITAVTKVWKVELRPEWNQPAPKPE